MISAKSIRETLFDRLQGDGTLLKDFGEIATFATVVCGAPAPVTGAALAIMITKTAGACISAATRIITRLAPSDDEVARMLPHSYDRFRILFYVLCQKSYFESLVENSSFRQLQRRGKPDNAEIDLVRLRETFIERAACIDEAEIRFHYSINPVDRKIPLYDEYSRWLSVALAPLMPDDEGERDVVVRQIAEEARRRLNAALAVPDPTHEWLRNYLALSIASEASEQVLSELAAISATLEGWKNTLGREGLRLSERWTNYRSLIQSLPDQKESMYNEEFGVSKVFISPRIEYHRAGLPGSADEPDIAPDLARLLGALVSNRLGSEDLIVLCGGPGSGKSTLCRVLASELAKDEAMHPVFLKLRRCRETTELSSFIEDSLIREGVIVRLSDLQLVPNVVLILDGFDELVLASRSKLRHFFNVLLDDVRSGPLRKAKVIVSGRDTLFPKGEGLPRGSHVLNVLPFDEPRVALWGEKWRSIHAGAGGTFHPELLLGETSREARSSPLRHLASWPLTLHLLAKVHTAGLVDLGSVKERQIEKAYLYRSILRETANRQTEQATGKGRLAPDEMREFLRSLAWYMYSHSVDSMAIEDVTGIAKRFFPGHDEAALTELAEVAIVNAPEIQKGEETGFEFVHKSFSEYLAAETIARSVERLSHRVRDIDGKETWHLSLQDAAKEAASVLAIRVMPREVQEMLEPMLGAFIAFQRGEKVEDTVSVEHRQAGLLLVGERFQSLYSDVVSGTSLTVVAEVARFAPLVTSPLEAFANYGTGVVLIGAAFGRRMRNECAGPANSSSFGLEPFEGALWRWLMLVHAGGVQVDGELAARLYKGVSLKNTGKGSTGDASLPIKLGLLQGIPGYQTDLQTALDQEFSAVWEVFDVISVVSLLGQMTQPTGEGRPMRDGNARAVSSGVMDRLEGRGEMGLMHLLEHADQRIQVAQEKLRTALERSGFLFSRNSSRIKRRRPFGGLTKLTPKTISDLYTDGVTIFCGGSRESVRKYLDRMNIGSRGSSRRRRPSKQPILGDSE